MRISAEAPVAFAVRVLLADGLRVPPFDVHPPGDQLLRNVGLTEDGWLRWVRALTARQDDATRLDLQPTSLNQWEKLENELEPLFRPAVLFPGPEALRLRLDGLWLEQRTSMDRWRRQVAVKHGGAFWAQVFGSLPSRRLDMTFHQVTYRAPVLHPVSPTAWLLSIGDNEKAHAVARRIERALE